ncbi:MAG: type II secretion system protein [Rhodoferax sp.]
MLAALFFILLITFTGGTLVQVHQTQAQREKEEQLLFAGNQYRRAIAAYYNSYPSGGVRALPMQLEDLLLDTRFNPPRQHLRQLYPDPITGTTDWVLVTQSAAIVGVRSSSKRNPIKTSGFAEQDQLFVSASSYAEWLFIINTE